MTKKCDKKCIEINPKPHDTLIRGRIRDSQGFWERNFRRKKEVQLIENNFAANYQFS